jgi:hypothetical protein
VPEPFLRRFNPAGLPVDEFGDGTSLARQNVDAFAEFLCFAAGQTAGINFTPPAEIRDKLAAAQGTCVPPYSSIPEVKQKLGP